MLLLHLPSHEKIIKGRQAGEGQIPCRIVLPHKLKIPCRTVLPRKLKPERAQMREGRKPGSPAWKLTPSKTEHYNQASVWGKFYLVEPQRRKLYLLEDIKELLKSQLSDV